MLAGALTAFSAVPAMSRQIGVGSGANGVIEHPEAAPAARFPSCR
jgi:hypothetical protein